MTGTPKLAANVRFVKRDSNLCGVLPQFAATLGLALLLGASLLNGCKVNRSSQTIASSENDEPILREGGLAVYQLDCPEFNSLPEQLKSYAYHLSKAVLAGRDIVFDQHAPRSLDIRRLLEKALATATIPDDFRAKITEYAVKFWAANGNYDVETSRKFIPGFGKAEFDAVFTAVGIDWDKTLTLYIFDSTFLPVLVNKNPRAGDAVTESAVNFFDRGIDRKLAESLKPHFGLNGRWALLDGKLAEEVYRAGSASVPAGRMSNEVKAMVSELEAAITYAPDESRPALRALIDYLQTGEPADYDRYMRLWVQDHHCPVDYIIGFIETYMDPLGERGSYEGMIFIEDTPASVTMSTLAQNAAWFEERMPWEDRFKKREFTLPTARAFKVLTATGDGGPHCPAGINLPNEQELRETVGTKNFLLTNVMGTGSIDRARKLMGEFLPTEAEREIALQAYDARRTLIVALHEVTGHGSGKVDPALQGDPNSHLREYASTLEEARADLVAYWFIGDPHLIELGIAPPEITRESLFTNLLTYGLIDLRDVPSGDQYEEDHARAGHLIINWIIANGGGRLEAIDGKNYIRLVDAEKAHQAVGSLLAEIQRIKGTGDYAAAKKLVETYGIRFDTKLRDEVLLRVKPLNIPDRIAFANPDVEPITNLMGAVKGFNLVAKRDFIGQMRRYGEMTAGR